MDGKDTAVEVAAMAALTVGWALVKRVGGNKAVKKAASKAGEGVATAALAGATKRGSTYLARRREDRKHRRLAIDLKRQIGGQVSVSTVIADDRYCVVWQGDKPVKTFPALPENLGPLDKRPELTSFVGHLSHHFRLRDKRHRLTRVTQALTPRRIETPTNTPQEIA